MDDVGGKVAVITGAAGGIGLGMAHAFASAGMRLVLADIDEERLADAVSDVQATGAPAIGVPTDVADRASVDSLVSATLERFGTVHLVCNNAGSPAMVPPVAFSIRPSTSASAPTPRYVPANGPCPRIVYTMLG